MNKINWGQVVIGFLVGALAMWGFNAYTQSAKGIAVGETYTGTITSVNKSMQSGKIAGDVASGASVQEYQFQIPEDLALGYTPVVGDKVKFDVNPYQAQDVSNVRKAAIACGIQSFAGEVNSDGSHLLSWSTSGAESGFIRYLKQGNVFPNVTDTDVTANISSGTLIIPADQIVDPSSVGYALIITCGPNSDNPGERNSSTWKP